jgi:hypothetical protein
MATRVDRDDQVQEHESEDTVGFGARRQRRVGPGSQDVCVPAIGSDELPPSSSPTSRLRGARSAPP